MCVFTWQKKGDTFINLLPFVRNKLTGNNYDFNKEKITFKMYYNIFNDKKYFNKKLCCLFVCLQILQ